MRVIPSVEGVQQSLGSAWSGVSTKASEWWDGKERWTEDQVRFNSATRAAARRALYFLRMREPDSDGAATAHFRIGALNELAAVTEVEGPAPDASRDFSGARKSYAALLEDWRDIIEGLGDESRGTHDQLEKADRLVCRYLRDSQPCVRSIRITYVRIPALRQVIRQHLGFILAFALAVAAVLGIEAVRSLVLNRPRHAVMGLFLATILPWASLTLLQRWWRARARKAPVWDAGGPLARSLLPAPLAPRPWVKWHPEGMSRRIQLGLLAKAGIYVGVWIACGVLYRGLLAAGLDGVAYTVYLIAVLLTLIVFAGGAVDFLDFHSQAPLRGAFLIVGGVTAGAILLTDSPLAVGAVPILLALGATFWAWRVKHFRVAGPVWVFALMVAIAAMTTGSRHCADRWRPGLADGRSIDGCATRTADDLATRETEVVRLGAWPRGGPSGPPVVVVAASGGGSRAAIYAARTLERLDAELAHVAQGIQAISSVSGGSLASAAYIARRAAPYLGTSASVCEDSLSAAVADDFIRPTLRGVLSMRGRGRAIEQAWSRCPVGLGDATIGDLRRAWMEAPGEASPFPLPIFNSVMLDRHAVLVTPLQREYFDMPFDAEARGERNRYRPVDEPVRASVDPAWVYYRSGIYTLSQLVPGFDAPLTGAVRASANFPFGFPLVEVDAITPLSYSPRRSDWLPGLRTVLLTDGGTLSNSGMWPLEPLLLQARADIGQRGVLLVIVDASRMPEAGSNSRQFGLIQTILDKNPKGERVHLQMLDRLAAAYPGCFAAVHVAIEPDPDYNVYTTWALDGASQRRLSDAFENAWQDKREEIDSVHTRLSTCAARPLEDWAPPSRVPLS